MVLILDQPGNAEFGAADSEGYEYLAQHISRHYDIKLNRWGDVD